MPLWGDSSKRRLVSETYSLSKDENLSEDQRKRIAEALPYLSDELKENVMKNGGYGKVLSGTLPFDQAALISGTYPAGSFERTKNDLESALGLTSKWGASVNGFLDGVTGGLLDPLLKKAEDRTNQQFGYVPLNQSRQAVLADTHGGLYTAGNIVGNIANYAAVSKLTGNLPGLSKISSPAAREFTANMAADTAVNVGRLGADLLGGEEAGQAAKNFVKNEGIDLGLNGLMGVGGYLTSPLSYSQYQLYKRYRGGYTDARMKSVMAEPAFQKMSPGEKAGALAQAKREAEEELLGFVRDGLTKSGAGDIIESNNKWFKADGTPKWPENNGFAGDPIKTTLQPGTKIDRYGNPTGSFAAPEGTPYSQRSLPPGSENSAYSSYEVVKPFDVQSGTTAPWFDQPGGGVQYLLPMSIQELIKQGYIK